MSLLDEFARDLATSRFGLPLCLHIPVAARNEEAVRSYVGRVIDVVVPGTPNMALLVETSAPTNIDPRLPIWNVPEAPLLHRSPQLWVHVDYSGYRSAYAKAFPEEDIRHLVLDHVMNRRVARLKDFAYLRLVPVSRQANSSSGGLSEKWAYRDEVTGKSFGLSELTNGCKYFPVMSTS